MSRPEKFCHVMPLWSSILQNTKKWKMNLYSQFADKENLWLTDPCFYSNICIIWKENVSKNICSLKKIFLENGFSEFS